MNDESLNGIMEHYPEYEGPSSEKRLDYFERYIDSYLSVAGTNPFLKTVYFDAFAGSGSRRDPKSPLLQQLKFTPAEEIGYKGAAERILNLEKGFDYYYFVDDHQSLVKLKERLAVLPGANRKKMIFRPEDCNLELDRLADALRSDEFSALILLDPLGFNIEWRSIERIPCNRSDLWLLLPTGVIVNKLLEHDGKLGDIARLEPFFSLPEEAIRAEFLNEERNFTLFGEETVLEKTNNSIDQLANLYVRLLKQNWTYVTDISLILRSSGNMPLYRLICASCSNPVFEISRMIIGAEQ